MSDINIGGVPIAKMKVTDLKNELDARGLSKTGKKDELVARLISYMEENGTEIKEVTEKVTEEDKEKDEEEAEKGKGDVKDKKEEQRLADEEVRKSKDVDEKADKRKLIDEDKAKKEETADKNEKLKKEEDKRKISEDKEEERDRDVEKKKDKSREEKRRSDEQKNEERKEKDEHNIKDRKDKDELKRKEAQKEKEEQKLKDEKRHKDRQRRFEEDQKAEDERREKSRAEKKAKEENSHVYGKNGIKDDDETTKKADNEEEALDFEPEAPVDDTLVMEVDQHDLVEDEKDAIIAAEPGEVTSLRKLGGNKSVSTGERKRGWGSGGRLPSTDHMAISSDSLKDLVPDLKPLLSGEAGVGSPAPTVDSDDDVAGPKVPKAANEPVKKRKKIEEDLNETEVIVITNLTRPFTVNQLKEMLKRTGTIVDFWIDRIKSKCCVEFSSSDQASETRMALNGVTWPQGNPKTLRVSFSSKADMKKMQEGVNEGSLTGRLGTETEERVGIRDWDKNKLDQERDRERERDRDRDRGRRDRDVKDRKDSVRERSEEKTPIVTKSLEDLFNKTTAGPAIYWRPLTEEEIEVKIKERNDKIKEAKIQKDMMESAEAVLRAKRMGDALGVVAERRRSRSSSDSRR